MKDFEEEADRLLQEDESLMEQGPSVLASTVSDLAGRLGRMASHLPEIRNRSLSELLERIRQLLMRAIEVVDRLQQPK